MTDEDVVQRVGGLWARAVFPVRPRRDGYRVPYITVLKGTPAVTLMRAIRPYMGVSRQEQIDRAVATWHGHRERRGQRHRSTTSAMARALNDAHSHGSPAFSRVRERSAHVGAGHCTPCVQLDNVRRGWRQRAAVMLSGQRAHAPTEAETMTSDVHREDERRRPPRRSCAGYAISWELGGEAIDKALRTIPIRLTPAPATCIVAGCDAPHRGRGLCHKHYMSWSRDVAKGRAPRITPLR